MAPSRSSIQWSGIAVENGQNFTTSPGCAMIIKVVIVKRSASMLHKGDTAAVKVWSSAASAAVVLTAMCD